MNTDSLATKEHNERKGFFPLRLDRCPSDGRGWHGVTGEGCHRPGEGRREKTNSCGEGRGEVSPHFLRRFTIISGQSQPPFHFLRLMRVHPVIKTAPLRVAAIQFFVGEFARVRATPCLGSEAFQRARPAAVRIVEPIGMQAGKEIRDG